MTVQYKGYVITRRYKDGYPDSLVGCLYGSGDNTAWGSSFEDIIDMIDLRWDGFDPEGYFNQY